MKASRKRPTPIRNAAIWVGGVLLVFIIGAGINALRTRPPVDFQPLTSDALSLDDGSWDHFEVLAVDRTTSRDDLQRLLDWLREQYSASDHNRVRIVIVNDRFALVNANADAVIAEYRQDRAKSEFVPEIF